MTVRCTLNSVHAWGGGGENRSLNGDVCNFWAFYQSYEDGGEGERLRH